MAIPLPYGYDMSQAMARGSAVLASGGLLIGYRRKGESDDTPSYPQEAPAYTPA